MHDLNDATIPLLLNSAVTLCIHTRAAYTGKDEPYLLYQAQPMNLKTSQIDWLNIFLMLLSAGLAFYLPFELFLLAYAVLGPLHYLTEISWLHQRQFFTTSKYDFLWLVLFGVLLLLITFGPKIGITPTGPSWAANINYLAFIGALAMVLFRQWTSKWIFVLGAAILMAGLMRQSAYLIFFAIFLPTIVHVYLFTGAFILYGALKSRSKAGLLSFFVLIGCGVGLLLSTRFGSVTVDDNVRSKYELFALLNTAISHLLGWGQINVYESPQGWAIMRFIAFAYTYHYLNWFAKTSIIKWHQISLKRAALITVLWLASVSLYFINYEMGFITLFTLSFLHVYLEFPLNHQCFIGIGRELKQRWPSRTPSALNKKQPALASRS